MNIERLLERTELFKDLGEGARKKVASQGKTCTLQRKDRLFNEGEEGKAFYLLMEGAVKLYKTGPEGQEVTVRLVKPGEIFAETILFESDRYPVSAVAAARSTLFILSRGPFIKLLEKPEFRNEFMASLMKKLRYLTSRILYLTAYSVEDRFFKFLLERYGKEETYHIALSKKDIAAAIGTIPETFSRLILRLKERGVLEWDRQVLKLRKGFWEETDHEA